MPITVEDKKKMIKKSLHQRFPFRSGLEHSWLLKFAFNEKTKQVVDLFPILCMSEVPDADGVWMTSSLFEKGYKQPFGSKRGCIYFHDVEYAKAVCTFLTFLLPKRADVNLYKVKVTEKMITTDVVPSECEEMHKDAFIQSPRAALPQSSDGTSSSLSSRASSKEASSSPSFSTCSTKASTESETCEVADSSECIEQSKFRGLAVRLLRIDNEQVGHVEGKRLDLVPKPKKDSRTNRKSDSVPAVSRSAERTRKENRKERGISLSASKVEARWLPRELDSVRPKQAFAVSPVMRTSVSVAPSSRSFFFND